MKKIIILVFCVLLAASSCRKDTSTYDGASIAEMYSKFRLMQDFTSDRDTVDFAAGQKVQFTALFNKVVSWKITITGLTSHAQKILSGKSRRIDASNGIWNGSTTFFPMFRVEDCVALLTIEDVPDSYQVNAVIKTVKKNTGLVIADFENGFDPLWNKFVQTGANMDFNIKSDSFTPQGTHYLNMAGTVNWDWLIGMIDFPATAYGGGNTLPLPSNPDNVYFNFLLYGVPGTNETLVLFQFKEDENGDGTFNAGNEDEYDYEIHVNWAGWKLISVKYSDIPSLVNGQPATPKGNSQHNPDKIGIISMLDLADPAAGFASCKIDYIIFTTNSPLEP